MRRRGVTGRPVGLKQRPPMAERSDRRRSRCGVPRVNGIRSERGGCGSGFSFLSFVCSSSPSIPGSFKSRRRHDETSGKLYCSNDSAQEKAIALRPVDRSRRSNDFRTPGSSSTINTKSPTSLFESMPIGTSTKNSKQIGHHAPWRDRTADHGFNTA